MRDIEEAVDWAVRVSSQALYRTLFEEWELLKPMQERLVQCSRLCDSAQRDLAVEQLTAKSVFFKTYADKVKAEGAEFQLVHHDDNAALFLSAPVEPLCEWALPYDFEKQVPRPDLVAEMEQLTTAMAPHCEKIGQLEEKLRVRRTALKGAFAAEVVSRALRTGVQTPKSILKEVTYYAVHGKWPGAVTTPEPVTGGAHGG